MLLRPTIGIVAQIEEIDIAARLRPLTGVHQVASMSYSVDLDFYDQALYTQATIMRMVLSRRDSFCLGSPILPDP